MSLTLLRRASVATASVVIVGLAFISPSFANGANVDGNHAYSGDCVSGIPSLNGNGDGLAVGRPDAGCVGKADDKFPPGQAPNGSDHNNGYECDGNSGIGVSNPAHTGCRGS